MNRGTAELVAIETVIVLGVVILLAARGRRQTGDFDFTVEPRR